MARFMVVIYSAIYPGIKSVSRRNFDDMERASAYAQNALSRHRVRFRAAGLACNRWAVFHVKPSDHSIEWAGGRDDSQPSTKDKRLSTREARKRRIGTGGAVSGTRARPIRIGGTKTPIRNAKLASVVEAAKQRRAENGSIWPVGGNPNGQE